MTHSDTGRTLATAKAVRPTGVTGTSSSRSVRLVSPRRASTVISCTGQSSWSRKGHGGAQVQAVGSAADGVLRGLAISSVPGARCAVPGCLPGSPRWRPRNPWPGRSTIKKSQVSRSRSLCTEDSTAARSSRGPRIRLPRQVPGRSPGPPVAASGSRWAPGVRPSPSMPQAGPGTGVVRALIPPYRPCHTSRWPVPRERRKSSVRSSSSAAASAS